MNKTQPHPVLAVLRLRRISNEALASATGYSGRHLGQVLLGNRPASPALRDAVAKALGVPIENLFNVESEAATTRCRFPGNDSLGPATGRQ